MSPELRRKYKKGELMIYLGDTGRWFDEYVVTKKGDKGVMTFAPGFEQITPELRGQLLAQIKGTGHIRSPYEARFLLDGAQYAHHYLIKGGKKR